MPKSRKLLSQNSSIIFYIVLNMPHFKATLNKLCLKVLGSLFNFRQIKVPYEINIVSSSLFSGIRSPVSFKSGENQKAKYNVMNCHYGVTVEVFKCCLVLHVTCSLYSKFYVNKLKLRKRLN